MSKIFFMKKKNFQCFTLFKNSNFQKKKIPECTEWKCPERCLISGRKFFRGKEMSRKTPLFQEKVPSRGGYVPKNATFPGEKATVGRKCPEKHHISGRKFHSGMEMS
jgi:hypothetical protein